MLQRVGLAQAMLNQPELIFLDEPTSGLDPLGRRLVRDIIYQLRDAGTTVFLNSHLLSEIEVTCNRVAFIKQGTVVQAHSMAELAERDTRLTLRAEPLTATLLAELKTLDPALDHHGSTVTMHLTSESLVPQVAQMVQAQGASLFELRPERQSLEEIFVNIIGSDAGDGR
jgi:ABC-2 type transport system ATP-binding protein